MPNSYPCDGIFNSHLTTIKDSYIQIHVLSVVYFDRIGGKPFAEDGCPNCRKVVFKKGEQTFSIDV